MALVDQLMNGAMANPDVLLIGVAAGFLLAKIMNMRSGGMGGMGGGF
jgi:hypothetical protein